MTNDSVVVILTALDLEYEAVLRRMANPRVHRHATGTRFETGTLRGTTYRVALGLVGKGNHTAAVLAERAIVEFSPTALLFVGVAGGLWPSTALGDVVVATHVYAYHGGTSEDDGLKARPRVWEMPYGVSQLAHHLARVGDWRRGLAQESGPEVHFGAVAAGEIVHDSRISYEAQWIRRHYNDALAIEMEAAGVAQAAHLNGSPVAVVRGISDRADGSKTTTDSAQWQQRAADNAAAFAVRLAQELIAEEAEMPRMGARSAMNGGGTTNNNAIGSVGIQAGHVTNSTVVMGVGTGAAEGSKLEEQLAALRRLIAQERANGSLDEATYEAAQAELDLAGEALEEDTPEGKSAFVLALKRLRGLIGEVAELAAKVAAVIAAVRGV
ncbi:5'-methylthioadenosine/S-adenosylhomocysteine nucleosidase family protein [Saccharomonospora cyanea]|uniref:Nucleoside phosphorylase n=1 Tax=Saccharomonospora cyanea NA-134 TaxID=882082 RepID=H5XR74_9PSEU|nr:5'-methylthioadenosine/S-adenosylhomocysteine nucleosidase [Saccharomonospora cyanea]EHR62315.1 nucleoside phosphorylase [Saccharomonospora cyanea NA-134]